MNQTAVKLAIDLAHFPSQVRSLRSTPLPYDVLILLRIVAGDEEAINEAAKFAGRSHDTVCEAAAFFVEQILLYPGADSYRVLGAGPEATYGELRRNMALLLRRLHPDRDCQGERAVYAARVTSAWSDLKSKERRAAYDRLQRSSVANKSLLRKKGGGGAPSHRRKANGRWGHSGQYGGHSVSPRSPLVYPDGKRGFLRRVLLLLFGRAAP
jgi:hypothetical protein